MILVHVQNYYSAIQGNHIMPNVTDLIKYSVGITPNRTYESMVRWEDLTAELSFVSTECSIRVGK